MALSSVLGCLSCGLIKKDTKSISDRPPTRYDIEGKRSPGNSTDSEESIDSASQFTKAEPQEKDGVTNTAEVPIEKVNRALIVASKGTYGFADQPFPTLLHDKEVIISNRATGLNPIDYKSVDYNFCLPEFPWITGREMAGVVEAVGAGVTNVKVGDHVWTSTYYRDRRAGCFQHYITVPAHTVLPLPSPSTPFEHAACLGVAGLTAAMTLWHWLDVPLPTPHTESTLHPNQNQEQEQEWLLIWGGSTITGQFATQLALASHLRVIAVTSSLTAPLARSLGAVVVERDNKPHSAIVDEIRSITGDHITRAIDLVGPKTAPFTLQALSRGKKSKFAPLAMMDSTGEGVGGEVDIMTVEMKRFVLDEANRRYAVELNRLVGEGRIRLPEVEVLEGGLDSVVAGLERLKGGAMGGRKIVVKMV